MTNQYSFQKVLFAQWSIRNEGTTLILGSIIFAYVHLFSQWLFDEYSSTLSDYLILTLSYFAFYQICKLICMSIYLAIVVHYAKVGNVWSKRIYKEALTWRK